MNPPNQSASPVLLPTAPLFIIGYRGTGKTVVAKLLAQRLSWQSIDADELLQSRQGRTISQIFTEQGEAAFRDMEAALLTELCSLEKHVIATGGGVILRPENRQRIRDAGTVIWLKANAATIWHRLQEDTATANQRPALTVGGLEEIKELLKARAPLYQECANLTVDTAGQTPEDVVEEIIGAVQKRLGAGGPKT